MLYGKFIYFKLCVTFTRALIQEDRVLKRKQEEALHLSVSLLKCSFFTGKNNSHTKRMEDSCYIIFIQYLLLRKKMQQE